MYEKINKVAIALIELTFCVLTLRSFFSALFQGTLRGIFLDAFWKPFYSQRLTFRIIRINR